MKRRAAVLVTLIVIAAHAPGAAAEPADPRWQPWVGCWMPAAAVGGPLLCVAPAGPAAVDVVSVADGQVARRERIEASGRPQRVERDGCSATETAAWSGDSRRVYITTESTCANGVSRKAARLVAMTAAGEWIDVTGLTTADRTGVSVARYRPVPVDSRVPAAIASSIAGVAAGAGLRAAAGGAPIEAKDVVEASRALPAPVIQAWLTAVKQPFTLDARRLVQLADGGVPAGVIDVMVALSYPDAFVVKPSAPPAMASFYEPDVPLVGDLWYGFFPLTYWSSQFYPGAFRDGYGPYGFAGYGGYWLEGASPVTISIRPGEGQAPHGQVVNGRGYSAGSDSSGRSGASGGDGDSSSGSGGSVGTASGGGRTAQPR